MGPESADAIRQRLFSRFGRRCSARISRHGCDALCSFSGSMDLYLRRGVFSLFKLRAVQHRACQRNATGGTSDGFRVKHLCRSLVGRYDFATAHRGDSGSLEHERRISGGFRNDVDRWDSLVLGREIFGSRHRGGGRNCAAGAIVDLTRNRTNTCMCLRSSNLCVLVRHAKQLAWSFGRDIFFANQ